MPRHRKRKKKKGRNLHKPSNSSFSSAQPTKLAQWWPVEFKTPEAANDFLANSSIPELERTLGAPVEWRKELVGQMPIRENLNQNIGVVAVNAPGFQPAAVPAEAASAPTAAS